MNDKDSSGKEDEKKRKADEAGIGGTEMDGSAQKKQKVQITGASLEIIHQAKRDFAQNYHSKITAVRGEINDIALKLKVFEDKFFNVDNEINTLLDIHNGANKIENTNTNDMGELLSGNLFSSCIEKILLIREYGILYANQISNVMTDIFDIAEGLKECLTKIRNEVNESVSVHTEKMDEIMEELDQHLTGYIELKEFLEREMDNIFEYYEESKSFKKKIDLSMEQNDELKGWLKPWTTGKSEAFETAVLLLREDQNRNLSHLLK